MRGIDFFLTAGIAEEQNPPSDRVPTALSSPFGYPRNYPRIKWQPNAASCTRAVRRSDRFGEKERILVKNKIAQLVVFVVLLALVAAPNAIAQSAATQVSTIQLKHLGTSSLGKSAGANPSGMTALRVKNHPDPDAGERASSGLQLPVPGPAPKPIASANRNASGFNGLDVIDQGLQSGFLLEPPDQGLCVANGFVFEGVNVALAVYDASTHNLLSGPVYANTFFGLDAAQFTSDPRCFFDTQVRRWFVTILQIDIDPKTGSVTNHSHGLIAVSTTDSPLSTFNIFSIDTTDDGTNGTQNHVGCPCFGDQPLMGTDANGFYYTTNEFSITALTGGGPVFSNGAQVYALSKRKLTANLSPTVVHFGDISLTPGHHARSLQPAQSLFSGEGDTESNDQESHNRGVEFFVSHLNFTHTLDNRLAIWALSGTRTLDEFSPTVELTNTIINSEVYGDPPPATQEAGPNPFGASLSPPQPEGALDSGDTRMQQVFFARGLLWTGLTTVIQQGSNFVAGAAYFVIRPDFDDDHMHALIRKQGYITVAGQNILYPAIAVNRKGEGIVGFTISGPGFFPSAAYAQINSDKGVGSVHVLGPGTFPDDGFTMYPPISNGVGRWGDYSAAAVDEHGNLWFATEYIPAQLSNGFPQGIGANWGTFIGKLSAENENDD
jgi:hypothetical protein